MNLPVRKNVFLICTNGGNLSFGSIEKIMSEKNATIVDRFSCKGYDTFGPFKLVGGIAKGIQMRKIWSMQLLFAKN